MDSHQKNNIDNLEDNNPGKVTEVFENILQHIWKYRGKYFFQFFILLCLIVTYVAWLLPIEASYLNETGLIFLKLFLGFTMAASFWVFIVYLYYVFLNFAGAEYGTNDNALSLKYTCIVIDNSQKWLKIHDDGEDGESSIYQNKEIANKIKEKLDEDKDFVVEIIFNKKEEDTKDLELVKQLSSWAKKSDGKRKRVNIYCLGDRPDDQYHYKINDTGYAYLTKHGPGSMQREYEYFRPITGRGTIRTIDDCLKFHENNIISEKNLRL